MSRMKSHLGRVWRFMVRPFGKCLLFLVNPVLARRDSQMLHAVHNLVRAEMDAQQARSEPVVAMSHQIVHLLNDIREFQRGSHSELMHVPVERIQSTLDALVSKNQATMEELQLTLDSLIREVVRVESQIARTKTAMQHPEPIVPRRRRLMASDSSNLSVHTGDQHLRPDDLRSTALLQRSG